MKYYPLLLILLSNVTCVNAQMEKEIKMKATFFILISYFQSEDTASIRQLFEREHNPADPKEAKELLGDCIFLKKLFGKYGLPSPDSLQVSKGANQENVVYVTIMQQVDTAMNLKQVLLGVLFYPDQFLNNPDKFLTYQIVSSPLKKPELKIIPIPHSQKNNR